MHLVNTSENTDLANSHTYIQPDCKFSSSSSSTTSRQSSKYSEAELSLMNAAVNVDNTNLSSNYTRQTQAISFNSLSPHEPPTDKISLNLHLWKLCKLI